MPNYSAWSAPVGFTQPGVVIPPPPLGPRTPTGVTITLVNTPLVGMHRLNWAYAIAGAFPIAGVQIERTFPGGVVSFGTVLAPGTYRSYNDAVAGATYSYRVRAYDNQTVPNYSAWSAPVSVTQPGLVDTTPPPAPDMAIDWSQTSTQGWVSWSPVLNVGVDHYEIWVNGALMGTPAQPTGGPNPEFGFTTVPATYYTVDVYAVDGSGNRSPQRRASPSPLLTPGGTTPPVGAVVRWRFATISGSANYTFEQNPSAMTSPFSPKVYSVDSTIAGGVLMTQGSRKPHLWTFSGSCRSSTFYDALKLWFRKDERLYLWDHYGRRMTIQVATFDPVPKRSLNVPWRHDYQITAYMLVEPV